MGPPSVAGSAAKRRCYPCLPVPFAVNATLYDGPRQSGCGASRRMQQAPTHSCRAHVRLCACKLYCRPHLPRMQGAREMAWIFDEYTKFSGFSPGIVTGKVRGGGLGRHASVLAGHATAAARL